MSATPGDLAGWLDFISHQHREEIDLALDRLTTVADRLGLTPFSCPTITVAGTNGKGSSICALESFYCAAGYRTACYTSPHLTIFNERIRLNGVFTDDISLCDAFCKINTARGTVPLTYFEFATLAAFLIFQICELDIVLLEVGLGGRLDATNIFPADVALITRIGLDHTAWLGNDKESIAVEKAGIIHKGCIAVISDTEPAQSLMQIAEEKASETHVIGKDFRYERLADTWHWEAEGSGTSNPLSRRSSQSKIEALPYPGLTGVQQLNNIAGVMMCLRVLQEKLPVSDKTIRGHLPNIRLAGRYQLVGENPQLILDVAHNPDSMELLNENLIAEKFSGRTHAVVAMLKDKDIKRSLSQIFGSIDYWYIADLSVDRGESVGQLQRILEKLGGNPQVEAFESVKQAWLQACRASEAEDRVVVFGSFHTVGVIIETLS